MPKLIAEPKHTGDQIANEQALVGLRLVLTDEYGIDDAGLLAALDAKIDAASAAVLASVRAYQDANKLPVVPVVAYGGGTWDAYSGPDGRPHFDPEAPVPADQIPVASPPPAPAPGPAPAPSPSPAPAPAPEPPVTPPASQTFG